MNFSEVLALGKSFRLSRFFSCLVEDLNGTSALDDEEHHRIEVIVDVRFAILGYDSSLRSGCCGTEFVNEFEEESVSTVFRPFGLDDCHVINQFWLQVDGCTFGDLVQTLFDNLGLPDHRPEQ